MTYLDIDNTKYSLLYVVYAWTNCLMVLIAGYYCCSIFFFYEHFYDFFLLFSFPSLSLHAYYYRYLKEKITLNFV